MPKYVLAYHGGATPEGMSEEDLGKVMGAWQSWMEGLGDALTDMGNPISVSKTVLAGGTVEDGGGANPISGYSLYTASDIDAAAAAVKDCPIFESGGSIEVAEAVEM